MSPRNFLAGEAGLIEPRLLELTGFIGERRNGDELPGAYCRRGSSSYSR